MGPAEEARPCPLIYRLWTCGTQRVLLWANPNWVRRFVRSCHFGAEGFEVMAPLTGKGFRNDPRQWRVITDPSYQPCNDEYRRYWLFYLLFGRLGYNSSSPREVWLRELRHRFASSCEAIEEAYRISGEIMPLITTLFQFSPSTWSFWAELYAGRSLEEHVEIQPSDPMQFYGVYEYADEFLKGKLLGKLSPPQQVEELQSLAQKTLWAVERGRGFEEPQEPFRSELRGTLLDFEVLAELASYHGERLRATTHFAFYGRLRQSAYLSLARKHILGARTHWQRVACLTDGIYNENLEFGGGERGHGGHWKDRLDVVEADIRFLESLPEGLSGFTSPELPHAKRPEVTVKTLPESLPAQSPIPLALSLKPYEAVASVRAYYRLANQTLSFKRLEMKQTDEGFFECTIPSEEVDEAWDIVIFFEIVLENGVGFRFPDRKLTTPYFVVQTLLKP